MCLKCFGVLLWLNRCVVLMVVLLLKLRWMFLRFFRLVLGVFLMSFGLLLY